jgi:ATP-dependent DNA helicase RecG
MIEGQNIEWKQIWKDEYLAWVCGLANANGGILEIGKSDDGIVIGLKNLSRLLEDIPNKIKTHLGIIAKVSAIAKEDLTFIKIVVDPYNVPISYKGKYFLRSGSTNLQLAGSSLTDFLLKKTGRSWEDLPIDGASIEDIDPKAIQTFIKTSLRIGRLPFLDKTTDAETILKNLRLINHDGKLSKAALIIFGKDPRRVDMSAFLKIGRFGNTESELLSQEHIESNAFELADKAIEILDVKYLIRHISYDGLSRVETPEYPFDAIRELLFNAIMHRQYGTAPITIRLYKDRLEIWNEGLLPSGWTGETLKQKHDSMPRNKLFADVFYKGGHVEAWGRGFAKVLEECKKYGIPEPIIEERSGGVSVTIFKKNWNESNKLISELDIGLNGRQEKAIDYLWKNIEITTSTYVQINNTSRRSAIRDLNDLLTKEVIEKIGGGNNVKYVLARKWHANGTQQG